MKSWWRTGTSGRAMPAAAATRAVHAPAASTTTGALMSPLGVATPTTRPSTCRSSRAGVKGIIRPPSSVARAMKPEATLAGSSQPSLGT